MLLRLMPKCSDEDDSASYRLHTHVHRNCVIIAVFTELTMTLRTLMVILIILRAAYPQC